MSSLTPRKPMTTQPSARVRSRKRKGGRCQVTSGRFWVRGYPAGRDLLHPRKVTVTYDAGKLTGDAELIADALERANTLGREMASPLGIFSVLLGLFLVGNVEVGGDIPTSNPQPSG